MSRFLTVLVGSFMLPSTLALGLPAPTVDQTLFDWDYAWETYDYNGDGTPDTPAGSGIGGLLMPDLVSSCGSDYPNPAMQPKPPEGCGLFTTSDGGEGFYLFYTPAGVSDFWRDRLFLRYDHAAVTYSGKNRSGQPNHGSCLVAGACSTGFKFCGSMNYVEAGTGNELAGDFDFCATQAP